MKNINHFLILLILILTTGCSDKINNIEKDEEEVSPIEDPLLIADSIKILSINDFNIQISRRGVLSRGVWNTGTSVPVLSCAGLWIGMESNGETSGSIVTTIAIPYSNYTSNWGGKHLGVFKLTKGTNYLLDNWPVNYGAPVNNSGFPSTYGDGMCWTSLQSDTTMINTSIFANPIKSLRVTQAIYGYIRNDLRNVIFIKYGITNLSSQNWNKVYIGFFSDTDLGSLGINKTGYDLATSTSYTYDTVNNYVTGFSFMETPKNIGIGSHRIMRKNNYINPDYGEYAFNTPEQIIYTLKGLSNSGQSMIDPVTEQETNFAFTGDPVSHSGWLDTPVDVRSILSTKSFSLDPGETTWITIAWIVTHDTTLKNSLVKLRTQMDKIKSEISLWQFH